MAKGEGIGRFVPDKLKPEIKATSFEGFISELQTHASSTVEATPKKTTLFVTGASRSNPGGGHYSYDIDFSGKGNGRRIGYHHVCAEKFLDNPDYIAERGGGKLGFAKTTERLDELYMLTTFVTADTMLTQIKEAIPYCQTQIKDADKVFTVEDYRDLHEVAEQQQLRPWE